jgi:hypothetical protein
MLESILLYLPLSNINSLLAGFSVQLFGQTLFALCRKRPVNKPMVILSVLFFLISTSVSSRSILSQSRTNTDRSLAHRQSRIQHAMLDVYRLYQGVVVFPETTGLSSTVFFDNNGTQLFVARSTLYVIATLLGDAVVVHEVSLQFCII